MQDYIQKGTRAYWKAIVSMFLGSIAAFGAEYCMQPIIPVLARDFSLTPSQASLAMSVGTAGMAVSMLCIAGCAGMLERKRWMTVALTGSAVIAVAIACISSFHLILGLRVLQGFLLAAFPSLAVAYISEEFDPSIVGLAVGIYISGTSIGGLLGRVVISTLTDYYTWRIGLSAAGLLYLAIGVWFWLNLPAPKHYRAASGSAPSHFLRDLWQLLRNRQILQIYLTAFAFMGAFVTVYNYLAYPLMAPPYNLSQTAIGGLFVMYLMGTFSSTFMGGLSDKIGCGKVLCLSLVIMLAGGLITLIPNLAVKIFGLAAFTFGFFAAHSIACGWAGRCAPGNKARASSLYMLFYYMGSSTMGTAGGVFLAAYQWPGVILLVAILLAMALIIAFRLMIAETSALRAAAAVYPAQAASAKKH